MEIIDANPIGRQTWNLFIQKNYPPIGAFMQSWEWGEFQLKMGRKIGRYFVVEDGINIAAFTLVQYRLRFGLTYGYLPRGPVVATDKRYQSTQILDLIKIWAVGGFPKFIFLRLEPPFTKVDRDLERRGFYLPKYYVQPRYNLAVRLDKSEEEILKNFHPSTRSNLNRAEKRGVTVQIKSSVSAADYAEFESMMKQTMIRTNGRNAYPGRLYFQSLFKSIPSVTEPYEPTKLSMGIFYGYQNGKPASVYFVVYFAGTATYLYGASYSDALNSKVATYLHWAAMKEARRLGLKYYDLGGIDEARWPSLTNFKKQFRGEKFSYIGNIDIPLRRGLHWAYDFWREKKAG